MPGAHLHAECPTEEPREPRPVMGGSWPGRWQWRPADGLAKRADFHPDAMGSFLCPPGEPTATAAAVVENQARLPGHASEGRREGEAKTRAWSQVTSEGEGGARALRQAAGSLTAGRRAENFNGTCRGCIIQRAPRPRLRFD